jgi:hypothetical protein
MQRSPWVALVTSENLRRSCGRSAGGQAGPQPDQLVLPRQTGEAARRQRGVDRRQGRYLGAPEPHDLRGDLFAGAEGLLERVEGERFGVIPAEVAPRDCDGPGRPVEGEDELLAVAVLEIAVIGLGIGGVPETRWRAAARVVVVLRNEDEPGVAGVRSPGPPWLSVLSSERSSDGFSIDRRPRTGRNSSGILSGSDSVVNASPARIEVAKATERPDPSAEFDG